MAGEWDILFGDQPQAQGQMLAQLLRQQQYDQDLGQLVGLVGGPFQGWGQQMQRGGEAGLRRLADIGASRAKGAMDEQQLRNMASIAQAGRQSEEGIQAAQRENQIALEKMRQSGENYRARLALEGKGPSAAIQKEQMGQGDIIRGIGDAIQAAMQYPQAFGATKEMGEYLPEFLAKPVSQAQTNLRSGVETQARARVFATGYNMIVSLAGKQLTPHEKVMVEQFLPKPNDNARAIVRKMIGAWNQHRTNYYANFGVLLPSGEEQFLGQKGSAPATSRKQGYYDAAKQSGGTKPIENKPPTPEGSW